MIDFHAPGFCDHDIYFFEGMDQQASQTRDFLACCARHFGGIGQSERFVRQSGYMRRFAEQLGVNPPPTVSDFFTRRWLECVGVNL